MPFTAGPQIDLKYVLTGPDGTRCVFNDPTDVDYVGALSTISGFDSPEVRESFEDLTEGDGGLHGPFYYGRRPMTFEGLIYGHATPTERNQRISRLKRATDALRADTRITWTPSGGEPMYSDVRRQQPIRIDGGWNKTFQLPLIAADPRFYSVATHTEDIIGFEPGGDEGFPFPMDFPLDYGTVTEAGVETVTNAGDAETFPIYTIYGPCLNPVVYNQTTHKRISLDITLVSNQAVVIDSLRHTVDLMLLDDTFPFLPLPETAITKYSAVNFLNTEWGGLIPGDNIIHIAYDAVDTGSKLTVDWRTAWL